MNKTMTIILRRLPYLNIEFQYMEECKKLLANSYNTYNVTFGHIYSRSL